MTLNTSPDRDRRSEPGGSPAPIDRRARLIQDVVGEITSWNPREWTRALRSHHKGGISLIHLEVLMTLEDAGPIPMGQLAERLDVSMASATGIVSRMERLGLVARHHDDTDRRVVIVERTEAGVRLFDEIDERRRQALTRLLETLPEEALAGLLVGHRAMHAARRAFMAERLAAGHDEAAR